MTTTFTCFAGHRRIASGPLLANALAAREALLGKADGPVLIFDDTTGRAVEVDTRGTEADVAARFAAAAAPVEPEDSAPRGRGRPKLGVVPREVTLLPRHWEWLNAQPGGASVALRKLVEEARKAGSAKDRQRQAHERSYHFMSAIAGDLSGFEAATRALFANDAQRMGELTAAWPPDVRAYALGLAFDAEEPRA